MYVKFTVEQTAKTQMGEDIYSSVFFNFGVKWGWMVNATPRLLYPRERDTVPILQEAGWAPWPVWTGSEYFASTGMPFQDS
jgi:hypothetical protein